MVLLRTAGLGVEMEDGFEVEAWPELLKVQMTGSATAPTAPTFAELEEGDCLAMEDRNVYAAEWPGRRIFVLFSETTVLVFSEDGNPIDEPDDGVSGGVQNIQGDIGFKCDWEQEYYRIPPAAAVVVEEQVQQPEQSPELGGDDDDANGTGGLQRPDAEETTVGNEWVEGRRCRFAFGSPPLWYGGLVGPAKDDRIRVGFDDGELREFTAPQLKLLSEGTPAQLLPPDETPEGLVENVAGLPAAAGFTFLRDEPVGVLVGERDWEGWGGEKMFQEHVISPTRFDRNGRQGRRRSNVQPEQDRLGFHTTKAGEEMEYIGPGVSDTVSNKFEAWNYGIVVKMRNDSATGTKFLVMYDPGAGEFVLQACNHWARMPADPADTADIDSIQFKPRNLGADDQKAMEDAWAASTKLGGVRTQSAATTMSREPPPTLVGLRRRLRSCADLRRKRKSTAGEDREEGCEG